MSAYTAMMRQTALAGWRAVPAAVTVVPRGYRQHRLEQRQKPITERAEMGCLSWIFFGPFVIGFLTLVLRLMLPLIFGAAVVAYSLVTSLLWGVGAAVDALAKRPRKRPA